MPARFLILMFAALGLCSCVARTDAQLRRDRLLADFDSRHAAASDFAAALDEWASLVALPEGLDETTRRTRTLQSVALWPGSDHWRPLPLRRFAALHPREFPLELRQWQDSLLDREFRVRVNGTGHDLRNPTVGPSLVMKGLPLAPDSYMWDSVQKAPARLYISIPRDRLLLGGDLDLLVPGSGADVLFRVQPRVFTTTKVYRHGTDIDVAECGPLLVIHGLRLYGPDGRVVGITLDGQTWTATDDRPRGQTPREWRERMQMRIED
ncbi:MAG: hypothetical protein IT463_03880 [Planctomycetes bacterium]|nr:hypothetical protein [Planctomycetota bacterium]